jgi:predicted nucleotidyltransferase component of viral defense system
MLTLHQDTVLFREAIRYTAASTGFGARLIEKDYYCSVILHALAANADLPMVFKGGTCLAKVHAGFYRLSEDMDFLIPVEIGAKRSIKRELITPVKDAFEQLRTDYSCFDILQPLEGANQSSQYLGALGYSSAIGNVVEPIKLEISMREPLYEPIHHGAAHTLLQHPGTEADAVKGFEVHSISLTEAYAEKFRAALTRSEVAVRDFFDIDYAMRIGKIDIENQQFIELVKRKVAIPGNLPVNISRERMNVLEAQIATRLRPVLREEDYQAFEVQRAIDAVMLVAWAVG